MNEKLSTANDKEIFDLTGCLSMCEKYAYTSQQNGGTSYMEDTNNANTTLMLQLYYSNVEHELRKQVSMLKVVGIQTYYNEFYFSTSYMTLMLSQLMLEATWACSLAKASMASMK